MNHRGVEFTVTQIEPGLWSWWFGLGDAVISGKTQTRLVGMAARKVRQRINLELGKARDPGNLP